MLEMTSSNDIWKTVQEYGFLPFFRSAIPGLSIEEHTPSHLWFSDREPGPWEWKGPVIQSGSCVYGKFFSGKAGFISLDWLPDFANYRRNGYDFDARYDDGLASLKDKEIWETVLKVPHILSKSLKRECGYGSGGKTGFDTIITRLQMQTYIVTEDFVYAKDKMGKPYGWGIAQYSLPEQLFGEDFLWEVYKRTPAESYERIVHKLLSVCPEATETQIHKLLK